MELLQIASEFAPVEKLYRDLAPTSVLEIGCWDGGTLKVWLEGCGPDATIVAVDPAHRNPDAYPGWTRPDTNLVVIDGYSQEHNVIRQVAEHAPFDWVFIDGDHADAPVRSDVHAFMPMVRPGGFMLLHDITPQAGDQSTPPGVLLDELEAAGREVERFEEINGDPWSHGIGLVHL